MKRLLSGILAFLSFSALAHADERTFSIDDALSLAMKGNPELRAFDNSVSAAGEDIGIARSNLLPKINFEERFMRTTNPTLAFAAKLNQERFTTADFAIPSLNNPDAINDFQTSISFEQPLYVRKAYIGLKMAKQEFSAKQEDLTRKKEEVAFNIIRTALMINSSKEFVEAAKKGVEDAKEHLRLAELRYDAKLGLYSDVLRARTLVAESEQRLISSEKNHSMAKRTLGLLLGLTEPVSITGNTPQLELKSVDHYSQVSLSRKDIKSLQMRYDNAKNNIELAKSDYYPMVGLGGAYMLNDHDTPFGGEGNSWQVSAFLRWSIFDGTLRKHESAKAKYKALEAAEYLEGLKKTVSYKIHEAYLGVEEARKNAELSEAAVKTAEEGERLVRARYENSLSPIVDLLDAQVSLDNARANVVVKKNEYRTAVANLSYESGTLLKDLNLDSAAGGIK